MSLRNGADCVCERTVQTMTDRERLIELIKQGNGGYDFNSLERIADHLLANGVIVPPCNVGDTVYCKYWNGGFVKCTVSMITQQADKPLRIRLSANGSVSIEYTVNDLGK